MLDLLPMEKGVMIERGERERDISRSDGVSFDTIDIYVKATSEWSIIDKDGPKRGV